MQERIISLSFDVVSNIVETGPVSFPQLQGIWAKMHLKLSPQMPMHVTRLFLNFNLISGFWYVIVDVCTLLVLTTCILKVPH